MRQVTQEAKQKSVSIIEKYYPDIKADIEEFAKENGVDVTDVSYLVLVDIIYPTLCAEVKM